MTTSVPAVLVVVSLGLGLVACTRSRPERGPSVTGGSLATSCQLVTRRCSRCHPLERVEQAHAEDEHAWRGYVRRMRMMPSSGIRPDEEDALVYCLTVHSETRTPIARLGEDPR